MDSFISKLVDQYSKLAELQIQVFSFNMCCQDIDLDPALFINPDASISVILLENYNKAKLDALLQAQDLLQAYEYYYSIISDEHFILVFSNSYLELPQYLEAKNSLMLSFRTYSSRFLIVSTLNMAEILGLSIAVPPDAISDKTYMTQVKDIDNIIVGTTMKENDTFTETYLLQEPPANFKPTGIYSGQKRYNDAFQRYYPAKIFVSNYFRTLSYTSVGLYSRYQPVCLNLLLQSKLIDFDKMHALIGANISDWSKAIEEKMALYKIERVQFDNVELNEVLTEDLIIDADSVLQISFAVPDFFKQFVRVEFVRRRLSKLSYQVHLLLTEEYVESMETHAFERQSFDIIVTLEKQIPEIRNFPVSHFTRLTVGFNLVARPYGLSFNSLAYVRADAILFGRRIVLNQKCFSTKPAFPDVLLELYRIIDPVAYALGQDARNAENVENFVRIVHFGGPPLAIGEFDKVHAQQQCKTDLNYVVKMLAFKLLNEAFEMCKSKRMREKIISDVAECLFNGLGVAETECAQRWLETEWRIKMRHLL